MNSEAQDLAQNLCSHLEAPVNSLYVIEHSPGHAEQPVLDTANRIAAEMIELVHNQFTG